jgi:hypothetical protein
MGQILVTIASEVVTLKIILLAPPDADVSSCSIPTITIGGRMTHTALMDDPYPTVGQMILLVYDQAGSQKIESMV